MNYEREQNVRRVMAGLLAGMTITGVMAQPDPHSIAPPMILQMDSLPNAGQIFIQYCLLWVCVERSTSCHGQCCFQEEADALGYGCSGDVYGHIPAWSHYAGWRCGPSGEWKSAGPITTNIKQCQKPRYK